MAKWEAPRIRDRHHEIIRLSMKGLSNKDIALEVGISAQAVCCILRSPVVRAEIARRQEEVYAQTTKEIALSESELVKIGTDAVRHNHALLNSPIVDVKLRAKIGMHFADRIIFNKTDEDPTEGSYREILRRLDTVGRGTVLQVNTQVNVGNGHTESTST